MHQNLHLTLAKRLIIAPAVALLVLGGCQANTVDYSPREFANVRIMNFAPLPAVNMDIYFWEDGQSHPAHPQSPSLGYGGGAVYTTLIPAATGGTVYHFDITPASHPEKHNLPKVPWDTTLFPGKKYTLIITTTGGQNFTARVIEDHVRPANADSSSTFVRFINMQLTAPKLSVHVNDATTGALIDMVNGSHGVGFNNNSDYVALETATDTSFAFFVTQTGNPGAGVIARLTDQTFTPGNFYTLIYAGDPARMPRDTETTDTARAQQDNYRLRAFDDNNIGNDQTDPIQPAFRYNIVNGLVPNSLSTYYNGNVKLGFIVNGENYREHDNFTFWPVLPLTPAGSGATLANGVWEVHYGSTSIPIHRIELAATATDDAGKNPHLLFDLNDNNKLGFDQTKISADTAISFVFVNGDSVMKTNPRYFSIGIPNYVSPDSIILLFVSAIGNPVGGSGPYTSFYLYNNPGIPDTSFKSRVVGLTNMLVIPASANQITITDSIGKVGSAVFGNTQTFTAVPGGIYEIVSVGNRWLAGTGSPYGPQLLVMHLNQSRP